MTDELLQAVIDALPYDISVELLLLVVVSALICVVINELKKRGVIKDGRSGYWSIALNATQVAVKAGAYVLGTQGYEGFSAYGDRPGELLIIVAGSVLVQILAGSVVSTGLHKWFKVLEVAFSFPDEDETA